MTNVSAISAAAGSKTKTAKKPSVPQRAAVYTVKAGENLTKISEKYKMTPEQFKAWTGLNNDNLQIGQKINLPQSKVPSGKGILTLADKYNMDFDKFCELNKIPKPYRSYTPNKDEMFYVCKGYGKNPAKKAEDTTPKPTPPTNPQTTPKKNNVKTITYNGKQYKLDQVPKCGYRTAIGGQVSVSHPGGSYPSVPVDANGNIVAEVIKFSPSSKGKLSGKTIMVNAGHGWGYKVNKKTKLKEKTFDIGTEAKDANKKTIEEWNKNRNYADNLISSLCAEGATVIYTTGKASQVCDAKKNYKADMLISIHCNANDSSVPNGLSVIYPKGSSIGETLAGKINANFSKNVNNKTKVIDDSEGQHKSIGILQINKNSTPSVLLEMGYMSNSYDIKNIDSKTQRQKAMDQVTKAVIDYLNPPNPNKK